MLIHYNIKILIYKYTTALCLPISSSASVVGEIMAFQRCVTLGSCEYATFNGKGDLADMMKLRILK